MQRRLTKDHSPAILSEKPEFRYVVGSDVVTRIQASKKNNPYSRSYRKVLERSYADLKDSLRVLSYALSARRDILAFLQQNVFTLDSIIKRIESYLGVRKANVFIPISIGYHKEVIIKEIERKLVDKREESL